MGKAPEGGVRGWRLGASRAVKTGDRWAALEPLRQGVRHAFGAFGKDVARGLQIRCDWGPQYVADAWLTEVKWRGMPLTPRYGGAPECTGGMERFIRTLKAQGLYLPQVTILAEARETIAAFIHQDIPEGLIARLRYPTPAAARAMAWAEAA